MGSGIYKLTNITNCKIYIGSAVNLNTRFNSHKSLLERNKHPNIHIQRAFNKSTRVDFVFEVIEECEKEKLIEREQFYIDSLKPHYNICKVAESRLGIKTGPLSKEHKRKLSEAGKRRKHSLKSRAKMSAWQIGRKMSDEAKRNMTLAKIGTSYRRLKEKWPCSQGVACKCNDCRQKRKEIKKAWDKENSKYIHKRKPLYVKETSVIYV